MNHLYITCFKDIDKYIEKEYPGFMTKIMSASYDHS